MITVNPCVKVILSKRFFVFLRGERAILMLQEKGVIEKRRVLE